MEFKIKTSISLLLFLSLVFATIDCDNSMIKDEAKAETFLKRVNQDLAKDLRELTIANWAYETDINKATSEAKISAALKYNEISQKLAKEAKVFDWTNFKETNQRLLEKLSVIGTAALELEDEKQYQTVTNQMETVYSSAKICVGGKCDLSLDPDLAKIMSTSTNYSELLETWVNWRDASGKKMRQDFITYYNLGNKAAKLNKLPNKKFETLDDLWLFSWETPDIKQQTAELMEQLKPFHQKLHAYVRMKLRNKYGDKMPKDGTIPAHLLGDMWAQQWGYTLKTVEGVDPYPDLTPIDVTKALKEQSYSSKKLFELSEKFFSDLGLEKMTQKFWELSILDKVKGKDMVCHASAWDFFETDDFRIKMCTNINMVDLITIHHEMGHIQYYQQYKDQHILFREGANPGFHEAIGDLLALSVSTPKHLKKIGLLKLDDNPELMKKINTKYQLKMALDKVMFLPFGYLMDKYRWDVFSGKVSQNDLNKHWWKLRRQYQGLSPPAKRSEDDFDPGAKYHVPANVEYIRYFVSHIIQFQFHKKLCSFREKNVPLHECDIDGDREAGLALKKMLQKGSSEKWPKQLKEFVGTEKMDVQPLLEYFQPLQEFLDEQLKGQNFGWTSDVKEYMSNSGLMSMNVNIISLFVCILSSITFIYLLNN